MKFIRKALLPAIIAATFLGFLGAVGTSAAVVYDKDGVSNTTAGPGDVCRIDGPVVIAEGQTADYTATIQGIFDVWALLELIEDEDPFILLQIVALDGITTDVNLDDSGGDSDITSVDKDGDGDTEAVPATDHLNAIETFSGDNVCGPTDDEVADEIADAITELIEDDVIDCVQDNEDCDSADWNAAIGEDGLSDNDLNPTDVAELAAGYIIAGLSCSAMADEVEDDLVDLGVDIDIAANIADDLEDLCEDNSWDLLADILSAAVEDREITVDVTCNDAGTFDLSFAPEWSIELELDNGSIEDLELVVGDALAIHVRCGTDVDTGTITALPTTVEINPAIANVAHSLVWVNLFDDDGDAALAGTSNGRRIPNVIWTTDRCAIEASAVDTEDEFEAAESLFRANNALNPATAAAIESSVYATTAPDGASRQQEEAPGFTVTGGASTNELERTVSAVVLHCDPIHAPGVTPGPAVVTAIVERGTFGDDDITDDDDLVLRTTVTVVGPPAANGVTVTAAPATLLCGEKATITVDVKDSIGQPVSDHTFVEAVTNFGGVLAGTGAVAGQAGLVSPISSTVAETFGGKATIFLLTSTTHVGKYEVVITTGGGGGVTGQLVSGGVTTNLLGGLFTTQPISVQVTVECTVPTVAVAQPQPTTTGPTTGQGIRPPSTGDAGLASTESSWVAAAAVAAIAALAVAGFSLKLVREE